VREYEVFVRRSLLDLYTFGKKEREEGRQLLDTPLLNKWKRTRRAKRTRGTVFIFISDEVVSHVSSHPALGQVHKKRVAHVLLPFLQDTDTFSRSLADLALLGHRRRRRRLGALLNTVRRWQALTGCNEVGSVRARQASEVAEYSDATSVWTLYFSAVYRRLFRDYKFPVRNFLDRA